MKSEKIVTVIVYFLSSSRFIEALHKSCADYFEGFWLPDSYNPNIPPNPTNSTNSTNGGQVENFTIHDHIFVKEITKVAIPYHINVI